MIVHNVKQGSSEWRQLRSQYFTASEAPAMMGCGYISRNDLLRQKALGIVDEPTQEQQRLFDRGHAAEAKYRPIAARLIGGGELYPITASIEINGLKLLASSDGVTMMGDSAFEHKLLNQSLVEMMIRDGEPGPKWYWQLEQQILVLGVERILFATSDGTEDGGSYCWYTSKPERRAALIAGWEQFAKDLAEFVPEAKFAPVVAAPVETLPAVSVRVDGALAIVSNLPDFGAALRTFIEKIPADPSTDQEFADTEAACKALKKAEEALESAETNALAQLTDVDTMRRFVADYKALARTTRLQKERLVAARKEAIKAEIVAGGMSALAKHIRELSAAMPANYMPQVPADFGGAIKGLRTVDSIRNAVDTELARAKIAASEIATRIQTNIGQIDAAGAPMLFADMATLVLKQPDDLAAVIAQRKAAEQARLEAERERIRAEEAARLEHQRIQQEQDRLNAERRANMEAARLASERDEAARAAKVLVIQPEPDMHATLIGDDTPAPAGLTLVKGEVGRVDCAVTIVQNATDDGRRLTLGQIKERIAPLSINADGLSELGFEPVETERTSKLYRESDFQKICAALIRRLSILASGSNR